MVTQRKEESTSRTRPCGREVRLSSRSSFQIGGPAREFYLPETTGDLCDVLSDAGDRAPFFLGGGCNTLFPDTTFERPVVSTAKLRQLSVSGQTIRAEAGVRLQSLVRVATRAGLGGMENLVGIPGTVGGAVVMNAGGSGWSVGDRVRRVGLVRVRDGSSVELLGHEVPWRYRSWGLKGYAVAWASFLLEPVPAGEIEARTREILIDKRRSQPIGFPSAGCVFKNPPGTSAGALIDRLGLKGLRRGGAVVSERHANFILNVDGKATARDVLELIEEVRSRVHATFQVYLETEIVVAT